MSRRPNILMICTDQQRWDTLGATGNALVQTPAIDALYEGGARVPHAYSQSPVCTPSRASFLTGRYPRTTRTRQNGQDIPSNERLLSRILADAGYTCGLAGKLHLSACHPSASPVSERRIDDGYVRFDWSHHPAASVADQTAESSRDRSANWPLNAHNLWLASLGARYDVEPFEGCPHIALGPPAEHHQTTWCAGRAVEFIEAHRAGDAPWMFSVNFFDPHHPFDPPRAHLDRYLDRLDEIPLPEFRPGEHDGKPRYQAVDHCGAYGGTAGLDFSAMSDRDHRLVRAAYWAMCDLISDATGRILRALDATGQREDTIVVFMSDHGEMLGDHGLYLKGPYFYEPAVRVPLVLNWPGTIPPQVVEGLVELVDLAPTLLDAAGLPPEPGMQGVSLWESIAAGRGRSDRESVYCEYYDAMPWHNAERPANLTMARTERAKIVVDHGTGRGELYDLSADPGEATNLWDDPDRGGLRGDMLLHLCDRMAGTVDPLPPRRAIW